MRKKSDRGTAPKLALIVSTLIVPSAAVAATGSIPAAVHHESGVNPIVLAANPIPQKFSKDAIPLPGKYKIPGLSEPVMICKLPDGRFFYVNSKGDMVFVPAGSFTRVR